MEKEGQTGRRQESIYSIGWQTGQGRKKRLTNRYMYQACVTKENKNEAEHKEKRGDRDWS